MDKNKMETDSADEEMDICNNVRPKKMDYSTIQLPTSQKAGRDPVGQTVDCLVNASKIAPGPSAPEVIYRHEIVFTGITDRKELILHSKGGKDDVNVIVRRKVLQNLLEIVLSSNPEKFGGDSGDIDWKKLKLGVVFDQGCSIYMRKEVPTFGGEIKYDKLPGIAIQWIRGVKEVVYVCNLVETIGVAGKDFAARPMQQFLDVLTSAKLDKNKHLVFGNKAYYTPSSKQETEIAGGKIAKHGFEKSVRPIGNFMAVQMDAKASPFFKPGPLINLIQCYAGRDMRDLSRNRQLDKQLRNLIVQTTHLGENCNRMFEIKGLTRQSAREQTFVMKTEDGEAKTVSVEEYFLTKYKKRLRNPDLPMVEERRGNKISYHPIEILEVANGQRVNNNKATPDMIEQLIKEAQMRPGQLQKELDTQKYNAYLDGGKNEIMEAFGIHIDNKMIGVKCAVIAPPEIKYDSGPAQRDFKFAEKWKSGVFVQPAKQNLTVYCLVFDRCMREGDAERAMGMLWQAGKRLGMALNDRDIEVREMASDYEELARYFESKKGKVQAIFGFTKDKRDLVHDYLKALEMKTGILTQHVTVRVLNDVMSGKPLGAGNIMMKFNQKLGGINHMITAPRDLQRDAQDLYNSALTFFNKKRMFIGLFLSHAGPQSFAERLSGKPQSEPTIVGMAYSVNGPTEQKGWWWMQAPGEQLIHNAADQIAEALEHFHRQTGSLPEDIVIYRNGKSEGEFKALAYETTQIVAACEKVSHLSKMPGWKPSLQTICVIAACNYRLFDNRNPEANVAPGTVLGAAGCHYMYKEFVLVSQRAILGTARPTRYTVVQESQGTVGRILQIDELKLVTDYLAYGTGIVNGPISKPSIIDSAEKLANRARRNYKTELNLVEETMSVASGGTLPPDFTNDGSSDFFVHLSNKFSSKLKNQHFWA